MYLADVLTLDAPKRTRDGYLAVRAKAARTGVYQYGGPEVDPDNKHGLRDTAVVNVLRDEQTVFDQASVASFIGKPITDDHPKVPVNAANWKDHARGTVMGAKWEQGGYLAFDLLLTDADAIAKVDGGKRELSNGYDAGLEYGEFKAADGTMCQARQTSIKGNHIALVDRGRAGPECRIADGAFALCDANPEAVARLSTTEKPVNTMLIDGLTVDVSNADTAVATIKTLLSARDAAAAKVSGLETQVATLTTDAAAKDTQIATLEQQLKDAKPTTAQLLDAAKSYGQVVSKAKALGVTVTDAMDEPAIMKAAVLAQPKLKDKAASWNDEQIAASFDVLTADVKVADTAVQPLGTPKPMNDAASVTTARAAWLANKQTAYSGQPA
ncbi:DUF2213 domain-containing protein [Sphingomonas koreensis]